MVRGHRGFWAPDVRIETILPVYIYTLDKFLIVYLTLCWEINRLIIQHSNDFQFNVTQIDVPRTNCNIHTTAVHYVAKTAFLTFLLVGKWSIHQLKPVTFVDLLNNSTYLQ